MTDTAEQDLNAGLARLAVKHGRTLEFRYAKGDGTMIETRRLQVEELRDLSMGVTALVGQDPDRNGLRAYRLDRIQGVITLT
jgi:predicted DNA-binding transcriptional regulator YafY